MKIDTICYEEKALVSMLYLSSDMACKNKIKNVPTKYFSSLVQSFIKKYKTYEMKNLSVDSLLEENEYKSFLSEAFELPVVVLEENIDKYTRVLENRYYKNCIIELSNTPNELIKEKINELHSEVVKENDKSIKVADIKDLENLFYESLEENEVVKTGKFRLDKYLKFTKRDLHIIGARPGVGKSAFALYIALMMAQFSRGLFFSLEMPLKQIAQRIISNQTRIELDKLTNKEKFKELTTDEKELVNVLFKKLLRKSNLILYDGNFKIDEL